jgi:hypothetical protein
MKLNIEGKEPEMAKIQRVKDKEGEEYIAKVICYTQSVANTKSFGDVYCVASIEHAVRGEIMFSLLFTSPLTSEQVEKQFNYMTENIDKILEDRRNA